jgi:GNAT superfamily N-acetyltransferase
MITYRKLDISEASKIADIDRTEHITLGYRYSHGKLEEYPVDWRVPRWSASGEGSHSVAGRVKSARATLEQGAEMIGAFEGNRLVGFAVICYQVRANTAQLDALFVSQDYRRRGIAERLTGEIVRLARQDGARRLYVSATPSESAVGFYRSQGFVPTSEPLPELFELEPEDIHMIMALD